MSEALESRLTALEAEVRELRDREATQGFTDFWHQGRYLDVWEKRDGDWKILHRVIAGDLDRWIETIDFRSDMTGGPNQSLMGCRGPDDPGNLWFDLLRHHPERPAMDDLWAGFRALSEGTRWRELGLPAADCRARAWRARCDACRPEDARQPNIAPFVRTARTARRSRAPGFLRNRTSPISSGKPGFGGGGHPDGGTSPHSKSGRSASGLPASVVSCQHASVAAGFPAKSTQPGGRVLKWAMFRRGGRTLCPMIPLPESRPVLSAPPARFKSGRRAPGVVGRSGSGPR